AVISECSDGSEAASDDSGSCGHNVTYVFDSSTGTLTISGSGDIYSSGGAPWYPYRSDVKKVVIEDGITDIGPYAFRDCTGLRELTLPISISAIGWGYNDRPAFYGCTNIEKVTFTPGTGKGYDYGSNSSPSSDNYYGCTPWYYSREVLKEVVIEDGVTSIGSYAFRDCTGLRELTLPISISAIGSDYNCPAFYGCTNIEKVTFTPGTGKGYEYEVDYYGRTPCNYSSAALEVVIEDAVGSLERFPYAHMVRPGSNAAGRCEGCQSPTAKSAVHSISSKMESKTVRIVRVAKHRRHIISPAVTDQII
ncbi:MAG: leucine-rich repeat domain-containing protein, partial [Methanomethylophilus alvi]|nr:leucine-rich repeat domain-containing protein [Methanomethylophilus alvi]